MSLGILATILGLFFGSFVLSSVGFGIGLSGSPFLLVFLDAKTTVVVINSVSLTVFVMLIVQNQKRIQYREMALPISSGLLGVPAGLLIFEHINPDLLSIIIAVIIIISGAFVAIYDTKHISTKPLVFPTVSFVVGGLLTSTGIGGPLMALAAVSQGWSRDAIRGSLPLFYFFIEGTAVVGYWFSGRFGEEAILLIAIGLFPALIGFLLASKLIKYIDEDLYRKVVIGVIISGGLLALVRSGLKTSWI